MRRHDSYYPAAQGDYAEAAEHVGHGAIGMLSPDFIHKLRLAWIRLRPMNTVAEDSLFARREEIASVLLR